MERENLRLNLPGSPHRQIHHQACGQARHTHEAAHAGCQRVPSVPAGLRRHIKKAVGLCPGLL